jgi:hypothetical protein
MNPTTVLLLVGVLACPIGMGLMMWMMNKNMNEQHAMPADRKPAGSAERLADLRVQRKALEAEMAEASRLVELEAKRDALLARTQSSGPGASGPGAPESQSPAH